MSYPPYMAGNILTATFPADSPVSHLHPSAAPPPPNDQPEPPSQLGEPPSQLGETSVTTKRKKAPRKLDSEKCQRCRKDKVKCTPQPSIWPQKCDRCESKGLECSAPESKRKATERARQNSCTNSSSERDLPGRLTPAEALDWNDLTDLVVFVQLLSGNLDMADKCYSLLECFDRDRSRIIFQCWFCDIFAKNPHQIFKISDSCLWVILSGKWKLPDITPITNIFGFDEVSSDDLSLLHVAITSGKADVALDLLRSGASVDHSSKVPGYNILHWAAAAGDTALYEDLQDRREVVHLNEEPRGKYGELPLHIAVGNGHTSMVKTILSTHSQESEYVNAVDEDRHSRHSIGTPLAWAM
ncbi:ankyrin repeat protein [Colletotrichum sojae]|uniref:Ankyrin repeat protein n=1 Tax=Colletotrichum sojae TaxID=2175907 RepID=A0A8H6IVT8_9PEZI|nr:ankyrin repeat protein [Colletotrichum sojae]